MNEQAEHRAEVAAPDRRQFLRRAAVVGTGLFVVPTIITVDPAGAQGVVSPPPTPPADVAGVTIPGTPSPAGAGMPGTQVAGRTTLPRTGAELDDLVVAGLAATAGGAALVLWSADQKAD